MRILHCCLANFYIDGFGYQENILPKAHRSMGHEVAIVASTETYVNGTQRSYIAASKYVSDEGIPVDRLAYVRWLPGFVAKKLRIYRGFQALLDDFRPEIVFLHDLQFLDIWRVRNYSRKTGATVFIDSHTDSINSARNWVSRHILHGIIYRFCARVVDPVTTRYFPTLPMRMDFMEKVYGLPRTKMKLLPFGVDDIGENPFLDANERARLRADLRIEESEIVLIAGGKIDSRKNILNLLRGFRELRNRASCEVTMLIFGVPDSACEDDFNELIRQPGVRQLGWLSPNELTKSLQIADVAVFPGTHSVLWEEAVGLGIPCVFMRWPGLQHVDIGGNCLFVEDSSPAALAREIGDLISDPNRLSEMKLAANGTRHEGFLYSKIAMNAISAR